MIDGHTAPAYHLLDDHGNSPVAAIPAHRPQDHLAPKMAPFNIAHQKYSFDVMESGPATLVSRKLPLCELRQQAKGLI